MKCIQEHLSQLLQAVTPSKMLAIFLCLDALFGHFKQSANRQSPRCQSKSTLHRAYSITKVMDGCSNIMEIAPNIRSYVKLVGYLKTIHS